MLSFVFLDGMGTPRTIFNVRPPVVKIHYSLTCSGSYSVLLSLLFLLVGTPEAWGQQERAPVQSDDARNEEIRFIPSGSTPTGHITELFDLKRPIRAVQRGKRLLCSSSGIAGLGGADLVDYLVGNSVSGCLADYMFTFDTRLAGVFTDANVREVMIAAQDRVRVWDGTNTSGLHQLFYFIHAAYFHEFFEEDVRPFSEETSDQVIKTSLEMEQAEHLLDPTEVAGNILGEWLIILDNPGIRHLFLDVAKRVLGAMTEERADIRSQRVAYNNVFYLMFRGIVNLDKLYMDAVESDGAMVDVLDAASRYTFLYPDNSYLITNAIGELGRLGTVESLTDDVVYALAGLLELYPYLSAPHIKVVSSLGFFVDCTVAETCNVRDAVMALTFPNRFEFDDGALVVETSLEEGVVQTLYHAAKQVESQFFRLIESITPLSNDENDVLTMRIYSSRSAYEDYQEYLYGLDTNNGGIYIESEATFYTYQRTPSESIYTLEDLFRHEFVHYLAGRYIIQGLFGSTAFYDNCALTWFDEGLAEFLAGSTQAHGVRMRLRMAQGIFNDGVERMSIDEILGSCYSSGFKFYRYSNMLFAYLYENERDRLAELLETIRDDDLDGFEAWMIDAETDTGLEGLYQSFMDEQTNSLGTLTDPETDFPALFALVADSPEAITPHFRSFSADVDAECIISAETLNRRFTCAGEWMGTISDETAAGSRNHYYNVVLDSWIESGYSHTDLNNFRALNCHFTEITDTSADPLADFTTTYECIGPLRDPSIALDSDGDGVADAGDDFPDDVMGWEDANGNGILDSDEIPDTDGDGMPDGFEAMTGFDPNDPSDASEDADSDGVDNVTEYQMGTDPLSASSSPAAVDLIARLRNDSGSPHIDSHGSLIFYIGLRFGGDSATDVVMTYNSTKPVQIEQILQPNANCIHHPQSSFSGTLDCGHVADGSSGLDLFMNMTPLQACDLDFTVSWAATEIELYPEDNSITISETVGGCPSVIPAVPLVSTPGGDQVDVVSLQWDTVPQARYYEVFRGESADTTSAVRIDSVETAGFNDESLTISGFYHYWIRACNDLGCSSLSNVLEISLVITGREVQDLPLRFYLHAAYPNPFNPTSSITFALPRSSEVRITATNLLGRQVATLISGQRLAAGYHTVQFNAGGLASGTYLIRMEAGDFVATQQVVLLK